MAYTRRTPVRRSVRRRLFVIVALGSRPRTSVEGEFSRWRRTLQAEIHERLRRPDDDAKTRRRDRCLLFCTRPDQANKAVVLCGNTCSDFEGWFRPQWCIQDRRQRTTFACNSSTIEASNARTSCWTSPVVLFTIAPTSSRPRSAREPSGLTLTTWLTIFAGWQ